MTKKAVFNGICGAESGSVPVSASGPGILISQIEVQKKAKSQERPPIPARTLHRLPGRCKMKRQILALTLFRLLPRLCFHAQQDDVIARAMKDEMQRSMKVAAPRID